MAKISSSKKIIIEELPSEQRGWFSKVASMLNLFLEQVYQIVTNGITISDNLKAQKFSVSIAANQVYPLKVKYTLNERPYAIHLARIVEDSGSPGVVPVSSFQWAYLNGEIQITYTGLNASKAYKADFYSLV